MAEKKTFKELTIKNNFMFGAVMCDESNCKELLEMVLQIPIERVEISKGKSYFLSTCGENEEDVPARMVSFLKFVKADFEDCDKDFGDSFVRRLQDTVTHIKESREMEERFMTFEQFLKEERADAKAEGRAEGELLGKVEFILSLLEELGTVSEDVREKIQNETDSQVLVRWFKLAAKAESMEQFLNDM